MPWVSTVIQQHMPCSAWQKGIALGANIASHGMLISASYSAMPSVKSVQSDAMIFGSLAVVLTAQSCSVNGRS